MKNLKYLIWLFPILVCVMIFDFSSDTGEESTDLSLPVTMHAVESWNDFWHLDWDKEKIEEVAENSELFIRKMGHMSEYALLAISIMTACIVTFSLSKKQMVVTWLFCLFYAGTDEFHQLFVAGRSGKILDVMIDGTGAFLGILLFLGIRKLVKKVNCISSRRKRT